MKTIPVRGWVDGWMCVRTQVTAVTASTLNMEGGKFLRLLKRSANAEHAPPEETSTSPLASFSSPARAKVTDMLMMMRI
jgi:hypothetical protein